MTWFDYLKESNKLVEYKTGRCGDQIYIFPCEPKPIKIVFESEPTFGESINKKASGANDKAKVMLSGYSNWSKEQLKEFIDRDIVIIYSDINGGYCEATINSSFSHDMDCVHGTGKYGVTLFATPVSHICKIDDNCVDYNTFIKVATLLKKINDIKNKDKHLDKIRGKRADCCVYDDCMYIGGSVYTQLKEILNSIEKENEDMPKIVNYKYNEEKGLTEITWSDKTITRVVAGDDTEKSAYVGFVSACAKKLFGNKSTYLNQFDKWTVKIPERERLAAEKKAAEDKECEEAKARKAAKKAERRTKREIESLAKEFADNYKHESTWEKAKKLAIKKYGVPADYFEDTCGCHCNCKEFDVMSEDSENNISD